MYIRTCSRTMAEICSGAKVRPSLPHALECSFTTGLPDGPSSTCRAKKGTE